MIHDLPDVAPQQLQHPPLKSMLGQLKFPHELQLADRSVIARLHQDVSDRYPRMLEETQMNLSVSPLGVQQQQSVLWRLTDFNQDWSLLITPESLSVETKAYTVWADFAERLAEGLDFLERAVNHLARERIGLRYVNEIREGAGSAEEWAERLNPRILGLAGDPVFWPEIGHNLSEANLQTELGTVLFRYGLVHQAPPEAQPPFYLLDIDCSDARAVPYDREATLERFTAYNDLVWRLFRWSLSDTFYDRLRG